MTRPVLVTVGDAAHHARIPAPTIRRWIAEGRLIRYRHGRRVRVDQGEVDQLAALLRTPNPATVSGVARKSPRAADTAGGVAHPVQE